MTNFWLKGEPYSTSRWTGRNRSGYAAAVVCLHGHLVRDSLLRRPDLNTLGLCVVPTQDELTGGRRTCGAQIVGACLHCGTRLRGRPTGPDVEMERFPFYGDDTVSRDYQLASCEQCGRAHPWATRK